MGCDTEIVNVALTLDKSGLIWYPEIGDEVVERENLERVSILVDPQGLTPRDLRSFFLWLPTTEQLVTQLEARQALIYHAGVNDSLVYEAVVRSAQGVIETCGQTLRIAFALALRELISAAKTESVH